MYFLWGCAIQAFPTTLLKGSPKTASPLSSVSLLPQPCSDSPITHIHIYIYVEYMDINIYIYIAFYVHVGILYNIQKKIFLYNNT